jgi:hypothetical protein
MENKRSSSFSGSNRSISNGDDLSSTRDDEGSGPFGVTKKSKTARNPCEKGCERCMKCKGSFSEEGL